MMKNKTMLAALLLIASVTALANPSHWVEIANTDKGSISILPTSIATDVFDYKSIWVKVDALEPADNVQSFKALYAFDCTAKKQGITHLINYDKYGSVISESTLSPLISVNTTADPDGFDYALMQGLCY